MLSVFSYIIKVSCPSVNENEAPVKNLLFFAGASSFIAPVLARARLCII